MVEFAHRHAGHCESGASASLLSHYGLALSEPMALGLSSAMIFACFPFIRVGGVPLTAYRMPPGAVYQGLSRNLGIGFKRVRFRRPEQASQALDARLAAGEVVGLQTSVYWLPYFPPDMRFHFNGHNLLVFGRDGDQYLISDPVFESPKRCSREALEAARFARGRFAPRGLMIYPERMPGRIDYANAGRRAIRRTCRIMLKTPLPWVGVGAIRRLAERVGRLDRKAPGPARLLVSSIIRMQEEIGTGGGGFRFMYAAFLQELGERLDHAGLRAAEQEMTGIGDLWRQFALEGAWFCKGRNAITPADLRRRLLNCAESEQALFSRLAQDADTLPGGHADAFQ